MPGGRRVLRFGRAVDPAPATARVSTVMGCQGVQGHGLRLQRLGLSQLDCHSDSVSVWIETARPQGIEDLQDPECQSAMDTAPNARPGAWSWGVCNLLHEALKVPQTCQSDEAVRDKRDLPRLSAAEDLSTRHSYRVQHPCSVQPVPVATEVRAAGLHHCRTSSQPGVQTASPPSLQPGAGARPQGQAEGQPNPPEQNGKKKNQRT